jgi:putative two-component system response regulator
MSHVAAILAQRMGWDRQHTELMLHASPMHDIGKIGIPDHILLKPGPLSPEEWAVMRSHPRIGADIIGEHRSTVLRLAREIALGHHEKWDGSGYPQGLAGEAIPASARIVAIADVFDALTTARPYKQAWTVEAAIEQVRRDAGKHFDPTLVELFMGVLPQVLAIRERWKEDDAAAA